jgi:hypothetical protein
MEVIKESPQLQVRDESYMSRTYINTTSYEVGCLTASDKVLMG